nr:hypothetical transcript [Hymenolepis microstoma]
MRHRRLARYYRGVILSFCALVSIISLFLCIVGGHIAVHADAEEIKTRVYLNPAATLILGILILLLCTTGIFGAWRKEKYSLLTFAALLFLLVVGEAIIGIMLITNRDKIKKIIKDHANDAARRHEGRESNFIVNWFNDIVDSIFSLVLCIYGGYIAYRADVEEIKTKVYLNPAATLFFGILILLIGIAGLVGALTKRKFAFLIVSCFNHFISSVCSFVDYVGGWGSYNRDNANSKQSYGNF